MNAPERANGAGYIANENMHLFGPNDKDGGNQVRMGKFKTAKDFLNSKYDPVVDKKTGQREYTESYMTPSDKYTDVQGIINAKEEMAKPYDV